jgi:hypothetical protein
MDITELMSAYRECVRGVWNNTFRPNLGDEADFDDIDAFWAVRDTIFAEFVLRQLRIPALHRGGRQAREPVKQIRVVPRSNPAPLMVSRPSSDENLYWDDPVRSVRTEGLSLGWVDFFDWNNFGFIDLQYHLVRIDRCTEHPRVVGRAALVEVQYANVHLLEEG